MSGRQQRMGVEPTYAETIVSATGGGLGGPGPEERRELAREDRRSARDDALELVDPEMDAVEEDDGEESVEEMLELDQTELDELGLTLDDPHQPDAE
jgi:hypothetical protein